MQYFNTTLTNKVPIDAYQVPDKLDDYPVWIQRLVNSHKIMFEYKKDLVSRVQVQVANVMISVVPGYWIIKRSSGMLDVMDNDKFNSTYRVYDPETDAIVNIESEQVTLNDESLNVVVSNTSKESVEPTSEQPVVVTDVVESTSEQPVVVTDAPIKRTRRRTKAVAES